MGTAGLGLTADFTEVAGFFFTGVFFTWACEIVTQNNRAKKKPTL
jgi:hypothetical protein